MRVCYFLVTDLWTVLRGHCVVSSGCCQPRAHTHRERATTLGAVYLCTYLYICDGYGAEVLASGSDDAVAAIPPKLPYFSHILMLFLFAGLKHLCMNIQYNVPIVVGVIHWRGCVGPLGANVY